MKYYYIVLIVASLLCVACKSHRTTSNKITNDFVSIFGFPDSLLTAEQDSLKRALADVFIEHTKYENYTRVFHMTKEEFIERGFPPQYYDLYIEDMNEVNKFEEKYSDVDWIKLFEETVQEYYKNKNVDID